jgi:hypothetical protein
MKTSLEYLLAQQISPQWHGVLAALAEEFESQISPGELRQLMFRIGERFANAHPLGPCATTAALAAALNTCWHTVQWGYVELADEAQSLRIVHHCAPLLAFGASALRWTPAFLEGAYQTWLSTLGATGLVVTQTSEFGDDASIEFHLARGVHA